MSELFPSRRRVVGGNTAGLGRMVNFMGATQVQDAGPAIAAVGNVIETYADNHYNKIADEKLNSFTGEVLNAAQTFNFANDAQDFSAGYRDKIAAMADGMPAAQANAFSSAANALLTRTQANLIGQAYEKDVQDQKAADIKELSNIIIGVPQAIQDASENAGIFEIETAIGDAVSVERSEEAPFSIRDRFDLSVENMIDSIDSIFDSVETKLQDMEAKGIYRGDEKTLIKFKSRAFRQVSAYIADGFISNADDQTLLEIGNSALKNNLPESLSDLKEYYSQFNVEDQQVFNADLVRSVQAQIKQNQTLDEAAKIELTSRVSRYQTIAQSALLDFDSVAFRNNMRDISDAIEALNQSDLPEIAAQLTKVFNTEGKKFKEQEEKNIAAALDLPNQIELLTKNLALVGRQNEVQARLKEIVQAVGKPDENGNIRNIDAVLKAVSAENVTLSKIYTQDNKVSTEAKAVHSLQMATQKFYSRINNMPPSQRERLLTEFSTISSSTTINTEDRASAINKLTETIEAIYGNHRDAVAAYDNEVPGTVKHRESVDALLEYVIGRRLDQGDIPSLFASVFEKSRAKTLNQSLELDSSYDFARDEDLDQQIAEEEKLQKGFAFLKDETRKGKPSQLITSYIKSVFSAPIAATPEEQAAQVEELKQLAQGVYQLYGDQNIFQMSRSASMYEGLNVTEEAFVRALADGIGRGFADSQWQQMLVGKGKREDLEQAEITERKKEALELVDKSKLNPIGFVQTRVFSGSIDDEDAKLSAYLDSEMDQILAQVPATSAEVLADMAMERAYKDGLRLSMLGTPLSNYGNFQKSQRWSYNPPEAAYPDHVKDFERFALEQIHGKADIPEKFEFFARSAPDRPDVRQRMGKRVTGRNLVLQQINLGVNVFFHKIESSPNDRPLYHVYARTKSGLPGIIKSTDGGNLVIDYNDQFKGDQALVAQDKKNAAIREAAMQRNMDLFRNTLAKTSSREAAKIIADETTEESLNAPPPKNELEYSRYSIANPTPVQFRRDKTMVDRLSPEEYPDFSVEGLPLEEFGDFDASPLPAEETVDFDASPLSPEETADFDASPVLSPDNVDPTASPAKQVNARALPPLIQLTQMQRQNIEKPQANGFDTVDSAARVVDAVFGGGEFLRRIAFVESDYGTNKATYSRTDRGIWQISPVGLSEVKRNTAVLRKARKIVQEVFGINVMQLEREDMDKPLQNAIVARLFLHSKSKGGLLPTELDAQANFWKKYYNTAKGKGTVKGFISRIEESQRPDQ